MQNENYYIVQPGDSLWSISKNYNISVDELKKLNDLSTNMLSIGQKLLVKNTSSNNAQIYYIVEPGDTLYGISRKYNISVEELKNINNLKSNTLSIGQKLLISGTINDINFSTNTYIVKKGDTLYNIANKYNITVDKLKDINNLDNSNLSIGQTLIIPNNQYIVKPGDTLYKIAQDNNITVTDLINYNNLPTSNLSIGQVINIPK